MTGQTNRCVSALALVLFAVYAYAYPELTFDARRADVAAVRVEGQLVTLWLEPCAAVRFHELTAKNIGRPLVIHFEGAPVTRAQIGAAIAGGHIQFSVADAMLRNKFVELNSAAVATSVNEGCASQTGRK